MSSGRYGKVFYSNVFCTNKCQQQRGNDIKVTTVNPGSLPPPASIVPKSKSKLKIADIDPLEMARQLTLMESRLYTKIRPIECLQRSRDMKGDTSDNISSVIQFANRVRLFFLSFTSNAILTGSNCFRLQIGSQIPYWSKKTLAAGLAL